MRKLLFVSAGLGLPGGISNLSGSVVDAMEYRKKVGDLDWFETVSVRTTAVGPETGVSAPSQRVGWLARARALARFSFRLRKGSPELVLFDLAGIARLATIVPRRLRNYEIAIMVHGLELENPGARKTAAALEGASLVIANSTRTAMKARALTSKSWSGRLVVVNPCVSKDRICIWDGLRKDVDTFPGSESRPTVLTVGRMDAGQPGKGHETLIGALSLVLKTLPTAKLVFVGDGSNRKALEQLAATTGVDGSIRFMGFVSIRSLGKLYEAASVFAMPGTQDGFGIVFAEAMYHHLPCIGSTADAADEVLLNGETGILVPYADVPATAAAILELLENVEHAAQMGESGYQRFAHNYTPRVFGHRLWSALDSWESRK